ncbi:MAG: sulfite exporter TauE/SafE family protein [Chlorobi bacterium]|nr:sulfite exporter TauE/SafE family protein [Chlorobiota bacterium]
MQHLLPLVAVGAITGLCSGLFGIGGALIGTPLLRMVVGMAPLLSLATPLPVSIPSALSGTIAYWRRGMVERSLTLQTLRAALPMTLVGSVLTHWTSGTVLMVATACAVFYVAIAMLRRPPQTNNALAASNSPLRITLATGFAGFIAGFLAIGGGMVLVPVFVRWLGVPIHRALATSLVCVAALAVPGTIVHGVLGHIDWQAAAVLAVASIPASQLGARLALRFPSRPLEIVYGGLLVLFGVWFLVRTLVAS